MGKRIGIERKSIKEFKLDKQFLRGAVFMGSGESVKNLENKSFI